MKLTQNVFGSRRKTTRHVKASATQTSPTHEKMPIIANFEQHSEIATTTKQIATTFSSTQPPVSHYCFSYFSCR
jgi:hypothetical protein